MVSTTERLVKSTSSPLRRHLPRLVRISVTDADATDSSSDDDGQRGFSSERRRVKRFVSHVNIERRLTTTVTAASRRQPTKRKRRRGKRGGKSKTNSSALDSLATNLTDGVQLRSPDAVTNLVSDEPDPKSNACSSESFTGPFDSLFCSDFFACDLIVPSVLDLFADPCSSHQGDACELGSLIFDAYIPSSSYDFGSSISGTTWPADEPMVDIGEIFGSDPLVAI